MNNVILSTEVDSYVESLKPSLIKNLGDFGWLGCHERLQKLHQQAIVEASCMKEEYVIETLIGTNKTSVLVYECITVSIWKQKILQKLLEMVPNPENTFVAYSVLFHEGIAIALLELVLYHFNGCESLGDLAADLLEYAYENSTQLLLYKKDTNQNDKQENGQKEILWHRINLNFEIGIRCLSILRFLTENSEKLTVCIASRIYNVHDVPRLLIQLLLEKPWHKGNEYYHKNKWVRIKNEEVPHPELQVWLTLRHLMLDQACLIHYALSDSRRTQLVKLLPLLTPILLDQISPLMDFNRWLNQIAMGNLPLENPKPILMELVLTVKQDILTQVKGKIKKIAKEQVNFIFGNDKNQLAEIANKLNAAYNTDLIEEFESAQKNNCKVCNKLAMQRCSICKAIWYCSRVCQVRDWPMHKAICKV